MTKSEQTSTPPLRVLVTGASSGVGEAAARLFSSRGAIVALVGRRDQELARAAESLNGPALVLLGDVSDPEVAARLVSETIASFGGLDIVINAAGVAHARALDDLTPNIWDEVIGTNLSGTFFVAREAGLRMRSTGGGSIVNVASDLAFMGVSGLAHYCASKAGVVGLTKALAIELAPHIRVNAVCPGPIDTPMLRQGLAKESDPDLAFTSKQASIPLGRLATPEEVAIAIYFLAVEATFATGTAMSLDGGTSAQ